jgi:hypothetical protein
MDSQLSLLRAWPSPKRLELAWRGFGIVLGSLAATATLVVSEVVERRERAKRRTDQDRV